MGGVPPSIEAQLRHAKWEGFTAWDLIMPLFLFVVGAAMPFSFGRRIEAGQRKSTIYLRVLRRVILLWVLGMIAQGNLLEFDLNKLQIYTNTLQCIAVGYLVAAVLLIHTPRWVQAWVTAGLLLGYWALMKLVPFDGRPAGTMEPGVSLAHTIDVAILGRFVYSDRSYGWILPSMNYIANVLFCWECLRGMCCAIRSRRGGNWRSWRFVGWCFWPWDGSLPGGLPPLGGLRNSPAPHGLPSCAIGCGKSGFL